MGKKSIGKGKANAKKSKKAGAQVSGISIELLHRDEPRNMRNRLAGIVRPIMQYLIVLALVFGAVFCFATMTDLPVDHTALCVVLAVMPALFMVLFRFVKKPWIVILASCGVLGVTAAVCFKYVINGALVTYDRTNVAIAESMKWSEPIPLIEWQDGLMLDTTVLACIVSA